MTIDDLLKHWALWRSKRDDNGLGYAASRLAILMGGGVVANGSKDCLPYGIDANSACAVVDAAVCRLPLQRRKVIRLEYCRVGTQAEKAKAFKLALKTYENYLRLARQQLAMQPDVKQLLKKC